MKKDINRLNREFKGTSPHEILSWSWKTFRPCIVASSSFQTQSVPLLYMIAEVCPDITIIFIDTGYHFRETLVFRDELKRRFDLNIKTVYARRQGPRYKEALYNKNPDSCCRIHKVEPMSRVLRELKVKAWVTGIRRDQTDHRSNLGLFEKGIDDVIRIHPLIDWKAGKILRYIKENSLPVHPLDKKGYKSIGCLPCTKPVDDKAKVREGRWSNRGKTECGLHTVRRDCNEGDNRNWWYEDWA